jgi:ferric-dicitrate binding protein FerR (iron transport regulator)
MKRPENKIIDKVIENTATPTEAREVFRWFATSDGNEYLSERILNESANVSDKQAADWIDHVLPTERMREELRRKVRKYRQLRRFMRVAAIAIPFIFIISMIPFVGYQNGLLADTNMEEIYVPKGERLQLILQDGTRVFINSDSRLRYPKVFQLFKRNVELTGEAYFEVNKESLRPFTVQLEKIDVKVLGTKFDIRSYTNEQKITVALDEGKVAMKDLVGKELTLKPGNVVVYDKKSATFSRTSTEIGTITSWKENYLQFENASLSELLFTLERQYNVKFMTSDTVAKGVRFNFSSKKVNLREVLWDLEKISKVKFRETKNGNYEVITRN